MLYRTLILGALAASSDALSLKKEPVMKLRGGLAGIDANQVTNVVLTVSAANAGVMALAPKKAGEMYNVASTKWCVYHRSNSRPAHVCKSSVTALAVGIAIAAA